MDYALMVAGSSFTVGVAEEERNIASVTEMADTTTSRSANPESSQYAADHRESRSQLVIQSHATSQLTIQSLHSSADLLEKVCMFSFI